MNVCDKSQINTRIVGPTKPSDPPFFGAQLKTYTSREYFEPSSTMPNILPLLKTTWHQNSPFNDLAPKCYVRDCTEPHYAGCIPVAIAQVGAYHQRPVMRFGNPMQKYSWSGMLASPWGEQTYSQSYLADLLFGIGKLIDVKYVHDLRYGGHSTSPGGDVTNLSEITKIGLTATAWEVPYNSAQVRTSLENRLPIIITGTSNTGGHAWVLDGYKQLPARIRSTYEVWLLLDGTDYLRLMYSSVLTPRKTLIHCNWGWTTYRKGVKSNGYYNEGVWDLSSAYSYDQSTAGSRDNNYDADILITPGIKPI